MRADAWSAESVGAFPASTRFASAVNEASTEQSQMPPDDRCFQRKRATGGPVMNSARTPCCGNEVHVQAADRGHDLRALRRRGCAKNRLDGMTIIDSPCVRSCTLEPATDTCVGCGRTLTEILNWRRYSDGERDSIMQDLPRRLQAFRPNAGANIVKPPSGDAYGAAGDDVHKLRNG